MQLKPVWGIILLLGLSACQVLQPIDTKATLEVERNALVAEATAIAQTALAEQVGVQATAEAGGTRVAEMGSVNQQLLATVRVILPPTPRLAAVSTAEVMLTPGSLQLTELGTADGVRTADGCADGVQSQFAPDSPEIYVTGRALNITSGTQMGVEWFYQGQSVLQDSWTIQTSAADLCVWYYITPADVPFSPGPWSVRLSANGISGGAEANFSISEGG